MSRDINIANESTCKKFILEEDESNTNIISLAIISKKCKRNFDIIYKKILQLLCSIFL